MRSSMNMTSMEPHSQKFPGPCRRHLGVDSTQEQLLQLPTIQKQIGEILILMLMPR